MGLVRLLLEQPILKVTCWLHYPRISSGHTSPSLVVRWEAPSRAEKELASLLQTKVNREERGEERSTTSLLGTREVLPSADKPGSPKSKGDASEIFRACHRKIRPFNP